jgi:hypothetical protein
MSGRHLFLALGLLALWQGWSQWHERPQHQADGVLVSAEPLQGPLESGPAVAHGRWMLKPRASYDITARILARENYHVDAMADLVGEDLALGWGAMSDSRVLHDYEITQGGRFYFWRPLTRPPTLPVREVIEHSANTHVIASDSAVAGELAALRVGQVVHLQGLLVDAVRNDGLQLHTSLTRSDTGPGACEVMLVEQVAVE